MSNFRSIGISSEKLLQFFDSGRNIFIGVDETSKSFGRDFLKEFGAELFPTKMVILGGERGSIKVNDKLEEKGVSFSNNLFAPIKKKQL